MSITDLKALEDKIDYLTKLMETHIMESEPCGGRKSTPKPEDIKEIIMNSPLGKIKGFSSILEKVMQDIKI